MNKKLLISILYISIITASYGQSSKDKIAFVIDSVPLKQIPQEGNEILQSDVADIQVIRNKDSLRWLGYRSYDAINFIFTKEYRRRTDSIKKIPSTIQMEIRDGFIFQGLPYNGPFIDYYYNGKKEGEGFCIDGKLNGNRKLYFQNGKVKLENEYKYGNAIGSEIRYYEDGSIKEKRKFANGKEIGNQEEYYPNGQIIQSFNLVDNGANGEITDYNSKGKVYAIEVIKNGKILTYKGLEKILPFLNNGRKYYCKKDYKSAITYYSKAIELDSNYAIAYSNRGSAKLKDFQFDKAIADFDKGLKLEPYLISAYSGRAFARIRKHDVEISKRNLKNKDETNSTSNRKMKISEEERMRIYSDLKMAVFLGEKSNETLKTLAEYSITTNRLF